MPSFSSPSSIRVASQDHALRLKITHNFVHGSPSEAVHNIKGRLPKEFDILWLSDLIISLSGSFDDHQIPAHDIARSGLVHHLQTQLKVNADRLGLNNVSRPFVDNVDGLSKLTLTPSRPLPRASRPHANLVSLHLAYSWTTLAECSDIVNSGHFVEKFNPFSPILFLPVEALLNRVTSQFLTYHLVGRYPFIFGPWCKRLDLEMQYFPSIGDSVVEIMRRSNNPGFLSKCKRLVKLARKRHKFVLQTCITALSACANDATSETSETEKDNHLMAPTLTDEQILCESMEQLFRVGVPQRRFKPIATLQFVSLPQDDDDLLPCMPDTGIDDEASWIELPEVTMSPRVLAPDSHRTLPEDTDIFAKEIWPEDGMCHVHGAGSLGEHEFDAESDESLISASIPSASITTHSPHACSFALYHHLDVDYREQDPVASGLRYDYSHSAYLEDFGTSALSANLTHSHSHDHHDSGKVGLRSCDTLASLSERDEVEDSDSILFDLDEDADVLRRPADGVDVVLDWDDPVL